MLRILTTGNSTTPPTGSFSSSTMMGSYGGTEHPGTRTKCTGLGPGTIASRTKGQVSDNDN